MEKVAFKIAVLSMYKNNLQCKSMRSFLYNGNAGLKWQRECMAKDKINPYNCLLKNANFSNKTSNE